mgnify:CR=1 FL=1
MDNWKGECAMATLQMYMNQSKIENMFTSEVYEEVWGKKFGVDNSVGKIRRILLHCPGEEIRQLKDGVYEEEAGARIITGRGRSFPILSYCKSSTIIWRSFYKKKG